MEMTLQPHIKDLGGGFLVRRLLPSADRQAVGPFLFFDHFGPIELAPGVGFDVRPHPHIGLATVTYLFEGAIMHRDSLGNEQSIEPGAINWMTAGRGIVHSERTPDPLRNTARRMHGLQLWAGLPLAHEEAEPDFVHTPANELPTINGPGWSARVLIGDAFGASSPVRVFSKTLYVDVALEPGAAIDLPAHEDELAVYSVDRAVRIDGAQVDALTMAVAKGKRLEAVDGARVVLIGGAPLEGGRRHMWWNFVSSSRERIEQAKAEWAEQRMGRVPNDTEFIPLP